MVITEMDQFIHDCLPFIRKVICCASVKLVIRIVCRVPVVVVAVVIFAVVVFLRTLPVEHTVVADRQDAIIAVLVHLVFLQLVNLVPVPSEHLLMLLALYDEHHSIMLVQHSHGEVWLTSRRLDLVLGHYRVPVTVENPR
jgi:hypothetical protein